MRVAVITTGLGPGGAEMMLFKLLTALDRSRFELAVFSLRGEEAFADRLRAANVPVHTAGLGGGPGALQRARHVWRELVAFDPQVIQGWMYHGNLAALAAARMLRGKRTVLWGVRQSLADLHREKRATSWIIRLGARWSRHVDAVVYNSAEGQRGHEAIGYARERGICIPNGFDLQRFGPSESARAALRRECGIDPQALVVGYVARYHPVKDHAGLVVAASQVAAAVPGVHFVMAGPGVDASNAELARAIGAAGMQERIHLLGLRADVAAVTAGFDVAVCASRAEGFPNIVGEAMACAVPCAVTDVGDCAAIVGDTGAVVPPSDPPAMAAALTRLLRMAPSERAQLGSAARARIQRDFSLESVASRYSDLFISPTASLSACAA